MTKPLVLSDYLDDHSLMRLAGFITFERGRSYYYSERVNLKHISSERVEATVQGTLVYRVSLTFMGEKLGYSCTCPVGRDGFFCKHLVATAMAARGRVPIPAEIAWQRHLEHLLQLGTSANIESPKQSIARQYVIVFGLAKTHTLGWTLLPLRLYVGKSSKQELGSIDWNDPEQLDAFIQKLPARKSEVVRSLGEMSYCLNADSGAYLLASLMINSYSSSPHRLEWFWRTPLLLYLSSDDGNLYRRLKLHPLDEKVALLMHQNSTGIDLQFALMMGEKIVPLNNKQTSLVQNKPPIFLVEDTLVRVSYPTKSLLLEKLLQEPRIHIPDSSVRQFMEKYFLRVAETITLVGEGIQYYDDVQPRARLYLSEKNKALVAELRFDYLGKEVPYGNNSSCVVIPQTDQQAAIFVRRNLTFEDTIENELAGSQYGLKRIVANEPGRYTLRAKVHILDFLVKYVPLLIKEGYEIYGEERIKSVRVNHARPSLALQISSGIDWFDLSIIVTFGDQTADWKEVRSAILKGQTYVKLADGSIGQIPEDWLKRFKKVFALGKATERGIELSQAQLPLIDLLTSEAELHQGFAEFEQRRKRLHDFEQIEPQPLPAGFKGELRPYQKAGYDWLHFLYRYKLGGCLADDMGLGKTVQMLAFLQSLKETQKPASAHLLVVPKSLLVNWQREAERFTPQLKFLDYSKADRPKDLKVFDEVDVVLTTYGIVLRDIERLRKYHFDIVILDESQAVKNPLAQSARAVRLLKSNHRLVMTGTPIENNTFELWSQFAFLQPGLLGSLEVFRREFAAPIESEGNEETVETLRKLVHPFILRRTKSQVAPELPPREERLVYIDMSAEQEKLYQQVRDYYRQLLLGMIDSEISQDQRMRILEGLLRLRQISIHPALVEANFQGEAPKFTWVLEMLETLQQEGHKALVFSQFVEALQLLRKELDSQSIPYTYLDGQTHNRQAQVDAFQNDPNLPFFLISLKAGGVGLNLTAADYVIHLDPWWNPAVERQAADRTHRIGQQKPVFIYKVILRNTVEEKILTLQEKKRQLVDQLIHAEGSIFKSLTRQDLEVLFS
jgi:non-specific serine/threonine protein kinase